MDKKTKTRSLNLFVSDKGGTGVTTACMLAIEAYKDSSGKAPVIIDFSSGDLHKVYKGNPYLKPLHHQSWSQMLTDALKDAINKDVDVFMDVGVNYKEFDILLGETGCVGNYIKAVNDSGFEVKVVPVATAEIFSLLSLYEIYAFFGDLVTYGFVQNQRGFDINNTSYEEYFALFEGPSCGYSLPLVTNSLCFPKLLNPVPKDLVTGSMKVNPNHFIIIPNCVWPVSLLNVHPFNRTTNPASLNLINTINKSFVSSNYFKD